MSGKNKRSTKKTAQNAIGISSKKVKRNRYQVKVLLDANKDDELTMLETIDEWKRKRRWLPTFRNAIRLFISLCEGRTDVLRELFPGIVESIASSAVPSKEVLAYLAILEKAAHDAEARSAVQLQVSPPKPTRDMDYDLPALDEEDDQVTQVTSTVDIAGNFMNSMLGMLG